MADNIKSKIGIWALIGKFGLKALSVMAKFSKITKVSLIALSLGSYAYLFTWKFAVLIMISLAIHEQGHVWAMKKIGIKTKGWFAIPLIGAIAIPEESYLTYGESAFVYIMGPLWGMSLAIITYLAYLITGQPILAAASCWMAVLNLFNCLPVSPLDGAGIMKAITFSIGKRSGLVFLFISLASALTLAFYTKIWLFFFFIIIGALDLTIELWRRNQEKKTIEAIKAAYDPTTTYITPKEWMDDFVSGMPKHPEPMNKKKLFLTIGAYVLTIIALFAIVRMTGHMPGADIAANFLKD